MDEFVTFSDTSERWLPVVGYEGYYEVSDLSRVRSVPRTIRNGSTTTLFLQGQIMTPQFAPRGKRGRYVFVVLSRDGRVRRANVHVLVARAFLGPPPPGHQVCHGPAGRLDNRLVNLSYGTAAKNADDRRRDGTVAIGARCGAAKLNDEIVMECRARHAAGIGDSAVLAREFGVSQPTMWNAITGKTWKHLPVLEKRSVRVELPASAQVPRPVLHGGHLTAGR